jgi:hypothetical protein
MLQRQNEVADVAGLAVRDRRDAPGAGALRPHIAALLLQVFVAARECPLAIAFTCACLSLTACTWTVEAKSGAASRLVHGAASIDSTPEPIAPSPSGSAHSSSSPRRGAGITTCRSPACSSTTSPHRPRTDRPTLDQAVQRARRGRAAPMMILLRHPQQGRRALFQYSSLFLQPSHPSPLAPCTELDRGDDVCS